MAIDATDGCVATASDNASERSRGSKWSDSWPGVTLIAVIACYALYFYLSDERKPPAAFIGVGALLISWSLIDRWTLWRRDRSGLMQVGQTILGIGLLALGIFLFARG